MMKRLMAMATAAWCAVTMANEDWLPQNDGEAIPAPVSATELIAEALSRLPQEPLTMEGDIVMRRARGTPVRKLKFKVEIAWGATPPTAVYEIYDEEDGGKLIETVTATAGQTPTLARTLTEARTPAEPPEWNERIQGTDVTWLDATMSFLWWDNPVLSGEASVQGRTCDRLDLFPPVPVPDCSAVRIWLDRDVKLLLQAEEYNLKGDLNRKLWVRSVKKINGRWMVRNIEVESRGTRLRTLLHVTDVRESSLP